MGSWGNKQRADASSMDFGGPTGILGIVPIDGGGGLWPPKGPPLRAACTHATTTFTRSTFGVCIRISGIEHFVTVLFHIIIMMMMMIYSTMPFPIRPLSPFLCEVHQFIWKCTTSAVRFTALFAASGKHICTRNPQPRLRASACLGLRC